MLCICFRNPMLAVRNVRIAGREGLGKWSKTPCATIHHRKLDRSEGRHHPVPGTPTIGSFASRQRGCKAVAVRQGKARPRLNQLWQQQVLPCHRSVALTFQGLVSQDMLCTKPYWISRASLTSG